MVKPIVEHAYASSVWDPSITAAKLKPSNIRIHTHTHTHVQTHIHTHSYIHKYYARMCVHTSHAHTFTQYIVYTHTHKNYRWG